MFNYNLKWMTTLLYEWYLVCKITIHTQLVRNSQRHVRVKDFHTITQQFKHPSYTLIGTHSPAKIWLQIFLSIQLAFWNFSSFKIQMCLTFIPATKAHRENSNLWKSTLYFFASSVYSKTLRIDGGSITFVLF